jgi:hypothetical protein
LRKWLSLPLRQKDGVFWAFWSEGGIMQKEKTKPLCVGEKVFMLVFIVLSGLAVWCNWVLWERINWPMWIISVVVALMFVYIACIFLEWYVKRNVIGRTEYAYKDNTGVHCSSFPPDPPLPKCLVKYRVGGWFRKSQIFFLEPDLGQSIYCSCYDWSVETWNGEIFSLKRRNRECEMIGGINLNVLLDLASYPAYRLNGVPEMCRDILFLAEYSQYFSEGIRGIINEALEDKERAGRSLHAQKIRKKLEELLSHAPECRIGVC